MSKHTGEVLVDIAGKKLKLKFDYSALATLDEETTRADLENLNAMPIKKLVRVLVIGLMLHHPEVTESDIMAASPPVAMMAVAIDHALMYARFGPETAQEIIDKMKELEEAAKNVVTSATRNQPTAPESPKKKTGSRKISS